MQIDGACHCGEVAFEAEVDPADLTLCHCTDCQAMSGAAFRTNIRCAAESFRLVRGTPRIYLRPAESGAVRAHGFCGNCGSHIYSRAADETGGGETGPYSLRTGVIRQRAAFTPARQVWLRSAVPWARGLVDVAGFEEGRG